MLSILIPTYNYNVYNLVKDLHSQCINTNIVFEILVFDDGSKRFLTENEKINSLPNCNFVPLNKNIGRSAIRNLLAQKATFQNLLFLDADVSIIISNFISNYLKVIKKNPSYNIVYGGIKYQNNKPSNNQLLRWVYGNKREALVAEDRSKNTYLSFLTLNFLIKKDVFSKVTFNETIPNLRYEDLLFSFELKKKKVGLLHINNQVQHDGIETSETFLQKTNESLVGLKYLTDHKLIDLDYAKITSFYAFLKKYKLLSSVNKMYTMSNKMLQKNLLSNSPSLIIYDIYRLGYFISL